MPFSSAGLAVSEAARNAARTIFIASGTGTSDLTGPACSPNTVHWTYDTYAFQHIFRTACAAAKPTMLQAGVYSGVLHYLESRTTPADHA